jgi:hypothetical protein
MLISDPDARLDPIARSWVSRFPQLFRQRDSLSAALASQLPPPMDAVRAQALTFARVGSRSEQAVGRNVPDTGADSIVANAPVPPVIIGAPDVGLVHTIPIVDGEDRLRGVVMVEAGGLHDPVWRPLDEGDVRWTSAVARLRRWSDSTSARGEARTVRGAVRVVPVAGRAVLVQTSYRWRSDGPPALAAVAVLDRGTVSPLESIIAAGGDTITMPATAGRGSDARFSANVTRLYERMREALRRGDWPAFGAAYDSLGVVVRQRPRVP